jgi:alkanesulfonate monooxygenase SsuD/methylene tetrahydromethanopterin reductase-like flavin-dependent oxidoreductase (luciferase family)
MRCADRSLTRRVAPATRHIGFVPTAITTHTEPFHLSKAIATLDYVSAGRAGIRVQVAARSGTTAHFGRARSGRWNWTARRTRTRSG